MTRDDTNFWETLYRHNDAKTLEEKVEVARRFCEEVKAERERVENESKP